MCDGPGCREDAAAVELHLDVRNNYLPSDYFHRKKIKPDWEDGTHPSKGGDVSLVLSDPCPP